ncbi:MAG TPA: class I SAM-dependent methyltransferase [Blastocatellia bacterium]|nr:class I SAM-dependent methyltransferase [Blastocatellia bacterium]
MTACELAAFYPEAYWGEEQEPSESWIRRSQSERVRLLSKWGLGGGRILDVGCGSGFFLRALDAGTWDRFGVEIGTAAAKLASQALGADRVFRGTLAQARLDDETFDVITYWSSLEHTNDPRANLLEARRVVRTGGTIIVQVPNVASYQARLFGPDWFALDVPRHRYHFTKRTLDLLMAECGFRPDRVTFYSKNHNAHSLKHSFKTWLFKGGRSALGVGSYYAAAWLAKPVDLVMSALDEGATLTVAARAV